MKVLIVDDESKALKLFVTALGTEHLCITAETAEQAYDLFEKENPDIVVSDIKLPGKSGISLLWKICGPHPDLPVILMTGHSEKTIAIQAVKAGAFDYLEKPFELEELRVSVNKAVKYVTMKQKILDAQARSLESERFAAIGIMAGEIAHEIISPLTVAIQASKKLKKKAAIDLLTPDLANEIANLLDRMHERILAIIKSLRNLSHGGSSDRNKLALIKDIVSDAVELCNDKFRKAGLKFTVSSIPEDLAIRCNRVEISQVILNLLNNASQAIEILDDRWITLDVENDGKIIRITVTDSGTGISPDIQSKLFDAFFTTKEIGKGTGMGLSVSKRLIKQNGGSLTLDPKCTNTRFIVTLHKRDS